ncbi:MAG TPA: PIN domain-containing protein [Pseudogracilibacillus sp.]|nr:PIN domain-containing protein [Pseudogracilibacillus sp.]
MISLYIAAKVVDETTNSLLVFFGIPLIGFLYFGYVHRLIFKNRGRTHGAAFISGLVATGLGQAYNGQVIKAVIFFAIQFGIIIVANMGDTVSDTFIWVFIIFYIFTLIDAWRNVYKAERKTLVDRRMKVVKQKADVILQHKKAEKEFGVDTNILMHEPDLLVYLLDNHSLDLYMSMMVFNELDGLKNSSNRETRYNAQLAFDVIEAFQQRGKLHLLKTPKTVDIRKYSLSGSPDEKIIGTYLRERENGRANLMFLSNDKGARILARNAGLPVVELNQ